MIPKNGLKYQAMPIQKKKAALAARSACNSFFNRFWIGMRPRTWGWASVVARTPITITMDAARRDVLLFCSLGVIVALAIGCWMPPPNSMQFCGGLPAYIAVIDCKCVPAREA